jgi:hypothetical protein
LCIKEIAVSAVSTANPNILNLVEGSAVNNAVVSTHIPTNNLLGRCPCIKSSSTKKENPPEVGIAPL